ncbi:MAG: hypothetical protein LBF09_06840 [Odoribacteraceae bacterium]|nr:hypothetical protein [Odoribacteraceae bacterium]
MLQEWQGRGDFNGEIRYFDDGRVIVKHVTSKPVTMDDGNPAGMIAVHDSLLICWHPLRDNFFNMINLDTGKDMGYFCRKGQGPGEAMSFNSIHQLFEKEYRSFSRIWLDRVRNRLYTIDLNSDEVYYLDLTELNS